MRAPNRLTQPSYAMDRGIRVSLLEILMPGADRQRRGIDGG